MASIESVPAPRWMSGELPSRCPWCEKHTMWQRDGYLIGEGGREGAIYECAECKKTVVRQETRKASADVRFAAKSDAVGARAHVRIYRAMKNGDFGAFLGVVVMEKHEAEVFVKMLRADFDSKDTTIRACEWCGDNICSAEGATGDKCTSCDADCKAGKPRPKGFDE